jgi:hypothetical protein
VGAFVHEPALALSGCPTCGTPEIWGAVVFAGGSGAIAVVFADTTDAEPALLLAVTTTSILSPTSAPARR